MTGLTVEFADASGSAVITRTTEELTSQFTRVWSEIASSAILLDERAHVDGRTIILPWASFLRLVRTLDHLCKREGVLLAYGHAASSRLRTWVDDSNASSLAATPLPEDSIDNLLETSGWDLAKRRLTDQQRRDLAKILSLRNAAIFSVPGAGKTTVALALHQIWASTHPGASLLVLAPKNAFAAWDEAVRDCLLDTAPAFTRLVGGAESVRRLLDARPRYAIATYGQLSTASDVFLSHLISHSTHLVLDESHRIKAGAVGMQAREVLRLSPYATRRDILSGTPMPQSRADLEPQFEFLYPSSGLVSRIQTAPRVRDAIRPLYARTRYSELGVPRPTSEYLTVEMSNPQRLLYSILRDDIVKNAVRARGARDLGRPAVMRLLQASIDPQTAAEAVLRNSGDARSPVSQACRAVIDDGLSPRLQEAVRIARESAEADQKIVVWVPFTQTIHRLAAELSEHGARTLFGGTPTGDADEDGTREQIIAEFHDSPGCRVLIANPAAGGEGISLHKVCHHALYVGRSYNATHYMQSRDRINRLGLPAGVTTRMTILESSAPIRVGSIDLSVRRRLDAKIQQLADALDDDDLRAIALESDEADPALDDGFTLDDLLDLLSELTGPDQQ